MKAESRARGNAEIAAVAASDGYLDGDGEGAGGDVVAGVGVGVERVAVPDDAAGLCMASPAI